MIQIVAVILIVVGLVSWVSTHPIDIPVSTQVQDLGASAATPMYFNETGMVVFEDTGDNPGVPWIVYQTPNRPIATKQLVFDDITTCDPGARELPCATDLREGQYPVTPEQRVQIQGVVDGEKVHVQRVTYL